MIQRLQASYAQHDSLFWCITLKGDDTVIDSCCFWNFSSNFECAEIGYELGRSFWRRGFAGEAIRAIIAHGFTTLGFHRIEANPLAANTSSRNLLFKLGFTYEGNLRERVSFRGCFEDQHYFGLLRNEWLQSA
jgi:ribosomal-protein-alanine N-acetyltransferase